MLLVCENVGQFRSNITGNSFAQLKIILLSERFVCNMISRCENKIVPLITLALRDLCWDCALLLCATPRRNFACFQNLVQVGKQTFVFQDKNRISISTTLRVALIFECITGSWNIDCHATKAPNEHEGGKRTIKAGFHMIADDRGSQTIAEPTVAYISVSGSVKITRALCWRENRSKQHGGRRGGNFAASKFISSFSP